MKREKQIKKVRCSWCGDKQFEDRTRIYQERRCCKNCYDYLTKKD